MARRNRLPRRVAQEYFREIRRLIEEDRRRIWRAFQEEIRPRIHEYRRMMEAPATLAANSRLIANDAMDDIDRILDRLRDTAMNVTFDDPKLLRTARRFVEELNQRQRRNFVAQVQRVIGFDPTVNEPWLSSFLNTAVQENVSWIKSIATDYHDKINTIIIQGVRRGISINDMAHDIVHVGDVSLKRGRFIARDQLGSLHGDLTKARQQRLGLKKFRWVTADDERVRDSHEELHDKIFTWEDGARNERGEQIWPGTDYNCRCYAEPVHEELEKVKENAA